MVRGDRDKSEEAGRGIAWQVRKRIIFKFDNLSNLRIPDIIVIAAIAVYTAWMGWLTVSRYDALNVFAYDFGIFEMSIYSTIKGNVMWQTIQTTTNSFFGMHFSPILFLLVPIYALYPNPPVLLVIQTFILALGALPLYLIASEKMGKNKNLAVGIPISYLLYPYLHNVNLYDFHSVMFAPLILGFTWYFMEKKNHKAFFTFLLLALMIKENVSVVTFLLGIYIFIFEREKLIGIATSVISFLWGYIAITHVIPYFLHSPYPHFSQSMLENIVFNPPVTGFLSLLTELFAPLAYIPLLNPLPYLVAFILLMRHASIDIGTILFHHYPAILIPFIFISAIYGISYFSDYMDRAKELFMRLFRKRDGKEKSKLSEKGRSRIIAVLVLVMLSMSLITFFSSSQATHLHPVQYLQSEHDRIGILITEKIPEDKSIAAQVHLVPRLTHRKYVFMLGEVKEAKNVDYILFDYKGETGRMFWPFKTRDQYIKTFELYNQSANYTIVEHRDGYVLFKRVNQS